MLGACDRPALEFGDLLAEHFLGIREVHRDRNVFFVPLFGENARDAEGFSQDVDFFPFGMANAEFVAQKHLSRRNAVAHGLLFAPMRLRDFRKIADQKDAALVPLDLLLESRDEMRDQRQLLGVGETIDILLGHVLGAVVALAKVHHVRVAMQDDQVEPQL